MSIVLNKSKQPNTCDLAFRPRSLARAPVRRNKRLQVSFFFPRPLYLLHANCPWSCCSCTAVANLHIHTLHYMVVIFHSGMSSGLHILQGIFVCFSFCVFFFFFNVWSFTWVLFSLLIVICALLSFWFWVTPQFTPFLLLSFVCL